MLWENLHRFFEIQDLQSIVRKRQNYTMIVIQMMPVHGEYASFDDDLPHDPEGCGCCWKLRHWNNWSGCLRCDGCLASTKLPIASILQAGTQGHHFLSKLWPFDEQPLVVILPVWRFLEMEHAVLLLVLLHQHPSEGHPEEEKLTKLAHSVRGPSINRSIAKGADDCKNLSKKGYRESRHPFHFQGRL